MAEHNDLGKEAEEYAATYLVENGYEILFRNWRYAHTEIDFITLKDGMLRIIEVKSRKNDLGIFPEESITKKKFRSLLKAADEFLYQNPDFTDIRFDVLSINIFKTRKPEFFLINDVFL